MALPPQKFREIVFQILYSHGFDPGPIAEQEEEMIPFMMNELKVTKRTMVEAHTLMKAVLEKQGEIDEEIKTASTEYSIERISRVELTILRLGLYEALFDSLVPPKVALSESIRLCRKFGTPESADFVNAILDGIYKKHGKLPEQPVAQ